MAERTPIDNAEVDYVDAETGAVLFTVPFYDPGLDENSAAFKMKGRRHLAYGCGRPL